MARMCICMVHADAQGLRLADHHAGFQIVHLLGDLRAALLLHAPIDDLDFMLGDAGLDQLALNVLRQVELRHLVAAHNLACLVPFLARGEIGIALIHEDHLGRARVFVVDARDVPNGAVRLALRVIVRVEIPQAQVQRGAVRGFVEDQRVFQPLDLLATAFSLPLILLNRSAAFATSSSRAFCCGDISAMSWITFL